MDQRGRSEEGRRKFLGRLSLALTGLLTAAAAVPFIGFLLGPTRGRQQDLWISVGRVEDFPVGSTTKVTYPDPDPDPWAGLAVRNAAWLRRESRASFIAFSVYCTHTGCPVRWVDESGLFLCPCHGGAFDRQGGVSAGPPPRPLDRPAVRIRNGRVEIQTPGVPTPN